jgi:(p)ppGpp synthase/HD superfamily hydrolase
MIEHCFGPDVVAMVKTLSKVPKEGYLERFYVSGDWRPFMIKACDRLDNIRSLSQTSPEFQRKQLKETAEKYVPLIDHMCKITPDAYKERSFTIRRMIISELFSPTRVFTT